MDVRRARGPGGFWLLLLTLTACGDAQSAGEPESPPVPEAAPAEPAPPEPAPVQEVAPEPPPMQRAPAPPPAPSRIPGQPQGERVIPVGSPSTPPDPDPNVPSFPVVEASRDVRSLAAGRMLDLAVEAEVSTESSRVGDVVYATVREDILGSAGEVLLPAGTRLTGHVVESRESPSADEPALLQLAFERVTVQGAERPLVATVVEMEVQAGTRDSNTRTAAKVGVGAAAGAIVGRILGRDRESTVKGAVVGGVAGTAAAIATRDGHAKLEPGARVVIRLDEALVLTP